jgi:hypothetical protein
MERRRGNKAWRRGREKTRDEEREEGVIHKHTHRTP